MIAQWGFEAGLGDWYTYADGDASHVVDVVDGALCSDIISPGQNSWDLTMRHDGIPLSANTLYMLTFDISTTVDRNISFQLRQNTGAKSAYIYSTRPLKSGTQSVEIEIWQHTNDTDASLRFWSGGQATGEICLDNILLTAVDTFVPSLDSADSASACLLYTSPSPRDS